MIVSGFPILEVADLDAAVAFYSTALGGRETYRFPDDGPPDYVAVSMGSSQLGLGRADDAAPVGGCLLWFYVDDVDRVTAAAVAAGATLAEEPVDMPWGERVSLVLDPFGTRVRFGAAAA